jgi:hypothetical protein
MQVLLKSSDRAADFHCEVCGEGFALFCERKTEQEQAEVLAMVRSAIHSHHSDDAPGHAHPRSGFLIPAWSGPIEFSGAALLSNAPVWALR